MYYGGWGHANVVKLNPDMTSLDTFPDGSTYKEIAPRYVEGSFMFKRGGTYYMMWSEGGWTGPDYSVSYAMSDCPTGPFRKIDQVLAQDPAVARGSGHNSVVNVPGTDIWYIVYHRRPLSETNGNHRTLAYDRIHFNEDGTIRPVTMKVKDNFDDGNAVGWRTLGGTGWTPERGAYSTMSSSRGLSLQDTDFSDLVYEADVTLQAQPEHMGLAFRVSRPGTGTEGFHGYYADLTAKGLVLGKATGDEQDVLDRLQNDDSPLQQGNCQRKSEFEGRARNSPTLGRRCRGTTWSVCRSSTASAIEASASRVFCHRGWRAATGLAQCRVDGIDTAESSPSETPPSLPWSSRIAVAFSMAPRQPSRALY
ncbi:hypothetical protein SBADM41S_05442 [Streptomyces badius]